MPHTYIVSDKNGDHPLPFKTERKSLDKIVKGDVLMRGGQTDGWGEVNIWKVERINKKSLTLLAVDEEGLEDMPRYVMNYPTYEGEDFFVLQYNPDGSLVPNPEYDSEKESAFK